MSTKNPETVTHTLTDLDCCGASFTPLPNGMVEVWSTFDGEGHTEIMTKEKAREEYQLRRKQGWLREDEIEASGR